MARPRVADDFAAIRARMDELRQEREGKADPDDIRETDRREAQRSVLGRVQMDLLRRRQRL
jgi:hypothetical protein